MHGRFNIFLFLTASRMVLTQDPSTDPNCALLGRSPSPAAPRSAAARRATCPSSTAVRAFPFFSPLAPLRHAHAHRKAPRRWGGPLLVYYIFEYERHLSACFPHHDTAVGLFQAREELQRPARWASHRVLLAARRPAGARGRRALAHRRGGGALHGGQPHPRRHGRTAAAKPGAPPPRHRGLSVTPRGCPTPRSARPGTQASIWFLSTWHVTAEFHDNPTAQGRGGASAFPCRVPWNQTPSQLGSLAPAHSPGSLTGRGRVHAGWRVAHAR